MLLTLLHCAEFLLNLFDPLVAKLQALATQGPVAAGVSTQTEIQVVEGELAWLVYIIGAVVGARGTCRTSEEHELLDGDLCARVFQTIQWVEMRQPVQVIVEYQLESIVLLIPSGLFSAVSF